MFLPGGAAMTGNGTEYHDIACQQVLLRDASVFSIQWTVMPAAYAPLLSPSFLVSRYLAYLRRCTISLIRPAHHGETVEFRLLGTGRSLVSFAGPVFSGDGHASSATLRICGGFLVQPQECHRGELSFGIETVADGVRITLRLSDYCPLLLGGAAPSLVRKILYRTTQASIHRIVTVRFLAWLRRELTGHGTRVRVVKVRVQEGEEI